MTGNGWITFCLAYIIGLLFTNLLTFSNSGFDWNKIAIIAVGALSLSILIAIATSYFNHSRPKYSMWLVAGIIAVLAVVYFQLRIPQPEVNDLSYQVRKENSQFVTITGKVLTEPRLTASQRIKFWLEAQNIDNEEKVSGKLYVTVPLLQGTGIYPGKNIEIEGILYLPTSANNPGSFDFKAYLARQGIFAGLQGLEVISKNTEPSWGWWKLRQRIVRSHLRGLGSPVGQLVSSMVLGRKAVDLSEEIRDRFVEAGLAHVLAASGFHVSLLLGIILKLTNRFSTAPQLVIGVGILSSYIGLTGLQPSVLRAGLMGIAVLIAIAMDTKVKPLGSLLLAATILLLFNPLWIGDIGFQLSFLATFGLIATLPAIQQKLDWLPPTIAVVVAVPIAASVWVLPLLSYIFNSVATYSIPVNIICTPLIIVISLGGMISAIAASIVPVAGSAIAWLLFYPTLLLIKIIEFFTSLPGSSWAIGKISLTTLLIIYSLFGLVWLSKWWQNRWWLVVLFVITLVVVPIVYNRLNLVQVTVLAAKQEQVIIIQDRGKVILINSGQENTVKYAILPFLAQQGINHIDHAVALDRDSNSNQGWAAIFANLPVNNFVNHALLNTAFDLDDRKTIVQSLEAKINTNSAQLEINSQLKVLKMQIGERIWLIIGIGDRNPQDIAQYIQQNNIDNQRLILLWSGKSIEPEWLKRLKPEVAVTSSELVDRSISVLLQQKQVEFYNTGKQGAIVWTPQTSFQASLELSAFNDSW